MPEKAITAAGYSSEQLALVRATCLYVATKLGDLMDDLVVVGGLVPSLLVDQDSLADGMEAHVGTMDLDAPLARGGWRSSSSGGGMMRSKPTSSPGHHSHRLVRLPRRLERPLERRQGREEIAPDVVVEHPQRQDVEHPQPPPPGHAPVSGWCSDHRKAVSVFPVPVGALTSTCRPAAINGHASACTSVGVPSVEENHSRISGWKTSRPVSYAGGTVRISYALPDCPFSLGRKVP